MEWLKEGVQFACQSSGKCCVSRGEYGFVYMNIDDRRRMAKHFKIRTSEFTKKYCAKTDGFYHLKEVRQRGECQFLEGKKCGVYPARPMQCRTWPFWPENLNAKTWKKEVASFCPGVGRGKTYSAEEVQAIALDQLRAEFKK